MSTVSFFGGLLLIIIGIFILVFKKDILPQNNSIKAFGMEFNFNTPAFVIMAFGVILMLISPGFRDLLKDKDNPKSQFNTIFVTEATYQSTGSSKAHGYPYVGTMCNYQQSCEFKCQNRFANYGDPEEGVGKLCIIKYYCSKNPSDIKTFKEGDSDGAVYRIACPN